MGWLGLVGVVGVEEDSSYEGRPTNELRGTGPPPKAPLLATE